MLEHFLHKTNSQIIHTSYCYCLALCIGDNLSSAPLILACYNKTDYIILGEIIIRDTSTQREKDESDRKDIYS